MILDVAAKEGRFNRSGLNPIESVRSANFYEVMTWYAMYRQLNHVKV